MLSGRNAITGMIASLGVVIAFSIGGPLFIGIAQGESIGACADSNITATDPTQVGDLDQQQLTNAQVVIGIGKANEVPVRGWVVALAAAMQESGLRNLDHGDRDSLGMFQQRPVSGWGTPAQIMNPTLASEAFYGVAEHTSNPGLLDIAGWENMTITDAAQAVQRSAFPDAYAQWEQLARQLVANLEGTIEVGPSECAPDGAWVLPTSDYSLTAEFGDCGTLWIGCHTGLDFAAPTGTPVVAAAGGTVTRIENRGTRSYGQFIVITHADGVETWFAHLDQVAADVAPGTPVLPGTLIGYVGETGNATGPHLHFEVRIGGVAIDPYIWLTQRGLTP